MFEKNENKQKEAGVGLFLKNVPIPIEHQITMKCSYK